MILYYILTDGEGGVEVPGQWFWKINIMENLLQLASIAKQAR